MQIMSGFSSINATFVTVIVNFNTCQLFDLFDINVSSRLTT